MHKEFIKYTPQTLKWLYKIPSSFHILSNKLISTKHRIHQNRVRTKEFSKFLENVLDAVEYDAQNKYTFKKSGELKTVSNIITINVWRLFVIQIVNFKILIDFKSWSKQKYCTASGLCPLKLYIRKLYFDERHLKTPFNMGWWNLKENVKIFQKLK